MKNCETVGPWAACKGIDACAFMQALKKEPKSRLSKMRVPTGCQRAEETMQYIEDNQKGHSIATSAGADLPDSSS